MRLLLFLFTPFTLLLAISPTAVTENDPSTLVDGVSVITGDFYLAEEDYLVAGAEPIPVRRFYLSAIGGIPQYPHLTATFAMQSNKLITREPNGTEVFYLPDSASKARGPIGDHFYGEKKQPLKYNSFNFATTSPGVTNTSTGIISAKSQLKNQTIVFDPSADKKGKSFSLYAADGTVRRYTNYENQEKSKSSLYPAAYIAYYYKLVSETFPNGRILHYEWNRKNQLVGMRTTNPQSTKTFASLSFPALDPKNLSQSFSLSGSDGKTLSYMTNQSFELEKVISPEQADQHFGYTSGRLSQISLPTGRTLVIQYEGSKVSKLLSPLGDPYYTFIYNEKSKTTHCIDALGNKTSYFWNDTYRLTQIDRFEGDQKHKNSETFAWEGTNLRSKVFYDETNTPLFAKTFSYDLQGNILEEILWGNISGRGPPLHIGSNGLPIDDGVEKAITKNTYQSHNLLKSTEAPGGLLTEYTYLPNTQLPQSKTLSSKGSIFSQTTYFYDENHTLIREVIQDGHQICKIQEIIPRPSEPYIGLPDLILEKYRENGTERLLKKTKLHYTTGARISQKDVYDAEDVFQYSLTFAYDAKGRLLTETNPIGQTRFFTYDPVGNPSYSKDFSGRKEVFYDYDLSNRLIKKIEQGDDGIQEECLYSYDEKHNLLSETDPYGNKTLYEYNSFGKRTKTTFPPQSICGQATRQTRYDSMGNALSQIDAKGNETTFTYNVLGKPTRIIHPDGAVEENVYNLDGTLALQIDPLGIETYYKYDALGRILEKRTEDATESFVYDGSVLIEKTDPENAKTFYRYDSAGRKIAQEIEGDITLFAYDSLGRLASQIEGDLTTSYQYDLCDRLIEEKKRDPLGTLLQITQFQYDAAGNQTALIEGKYSTTRFGYDSFNRQIRKTAFPPSSKGMAPRSQDTHTIFAATRLPSSNPMAPSYLTNIPAWATSTIFSPLIKLWIIG